MEVTSDSSRYGIAAIVGQLYGTTGGVENCLNRASVKGGQYVGGIVGYVGYGPAAPRGLQELRQCGGCDLLKATARRASRPISAARWQWRTATAPAPSPAEAGTPAASARMWTAPTHR